MRSVLVLFERSALCMYSARVTSVQAILFSEWFAAAVVAGRL